MQADAATGNKQFLARTAAEPMGASYNYDQTTLISTQDPSIIATIVEDDFVTMHVEVSGSYTYDTKIGGRNTVPEFKVNIINVTGQTRQESSRRPRQEHPRPATWVGAFMCVILPADWRLRVCCPTFSPPKYRYGARHSIRIVPRQFLDSSSHRSSPRIEGRCCGPAGRPPVAGGVRFPAPRPLFGAYGLFHARSGRS